MKACSKCKVVKCMTEFALRNDVKSGRASQCKPCRMEYHYANREALLAKKKEYTAQNLVEIRAKQRAMYQADPTKFKNKTAAYRNANPEKVQAYNLATREASARKAAKYRAENPNQVRADKAARRARILQAEGSYSAMDISTLMRLQRQKCAVCHCDISANYHIDHIKPLARGGSNYKSNLQLLCPPCNQVKSAKDPVKFMQSRGFLL